MTVQELIEKLSALPKEKRDGPVFIEHFTGDDNDDSLYDIECVGEWENCTVLAFDHD